MRPPPSKCPRLLSWGLSPPKTHIHLEAQNDFLWQSGLCRRSQSRVILDLGWVLSPGFRTRVSEKRRDTETQRQEGDLEQGAPVQAGAAPGGRCLPAKEPRGFLAIPEAGQRPGTPSQTALEGTSPAGTWSSHLWLPELGAGKFLNSCCCLRLPCPHLLRPPSDPPASRWEVLEVAFAAGHCRAPPLSGPGVSRCRGLGQSCAFQTGFPVHPQGQWGLFLLVGAPQFPPPTPASSLLLPGELLVLPYGPVL